MGLKILGIDIGSFETRAVIAEQDEAGVVRIIGIGKEKSQGVKNGAISNIEEVAISVKNALNTAQKIAGTRYDRVVVSISGANVKSVNSRGVVNIPNHQITLREIERVMESAESYKVDMPTNYEKIHVLPYNFKVDEQDNIEDPLGMTGSRLEVQTHIIIAPTSMVSNIRSAIKKAGILIDNLVLSGYASAIATLSDDERELGVVLVDIGSSTTDIVIHHGNSIIFNYFFPLGSGRITNDLSIALQTPISKAEELKINYANLMSKSVDFIEVPLLGDEKESKTFSLDVLSKPIQIRLEENLGVVLSSIQEAQKTNEKLKETIGAGIVFTGGMTKLEGFKEIADLMFAQMRVRVAKPKNLEGFYEVMSDPANSCVVGLCLYGAGKFTPYEIDSEKRMRYKGENIPKSKNSDSFLNVKDEIEIEKNDEKKDEIGGGFEIKTQDEKSDLLDISNLGEQKKEPNFLVKIWQKIINWFF
ncbi:cell division protein FtsA [Campylobacter gastrosuis]|uniref:Cell division protein FtsA n=1 Tax=Campylobacter gastrosuis TaxID=2974576 RepID=A0ABT7HRS8_9BACT|nr:cell division protein FtsA [Campylobacter gastrosuis]MDL0089123.1 cell division protein FtsA [Campylobacter gastrosuis]